MIKKIGLLLILININNGFSTTIFEDLLVEKPESILPTPVDVSFGSFSHFYIVRFFGASESSYGISFTKSDNYTEDQQIIVTLEVRSGYGDNEKVLSTWKGKTDYYTSLPAYIPLYYNDGSGSKKLFLYVKDFDRAQRTGPVPSYHYAGIESEITFTLESNLTITGIAKNKVHIYYQKKSSNK